MEAQLKQDITNVIRGHMKALGLEPTPENVIPRLWDIWKELDKFGLLRPGMTYDHFRAAAVWQGMVYDAQG